MRVRTEWINDVLRLSVVLAITSPPGWQGRVQMASQMSWTEGEGNCPGDICIHTHTPTRNRAF